MGAPDLLRHLREAGFAAELVDGDGIRVAPSAHLTDADRRALREHRADILSLLKRSKGARGPDEWCWPRSEAMNGLEIERFAKRAREFVRRGLPPSSADTHADQLVIRDRESDDRRTCFECLNYRPGRCGSPRRAGLPSAGIGADFATLLQRCHGYLEDPSLTTIDQSNGASSA